MRKLEMVRRLQQETRAVLRLGPLALAALLIAALLWQPDIAALSGLFQSSPVDTPPPEPATPIPSPTETSTVVPTDALTPTLEPSQPAPVETQTVTVTDTVEPEATLTLTPTMTETPAEPSPTVTSTPLPAGETASPEPTPGEQGRYPAEDSNLKFEWSMLFDSVSLFLSYLWLCCGVLVFLAIPFFFIALWVAGKRRRQPEE